MFYTSLTNLEYLPVLISGIVVVSEKVMQIEINDAS